MSISTIGGITCGTAFGFLAYHPVLACALFALGGSLVYLNRSA